MELPEYWQKVMINDKIAKVYPTIPTVFWLRFVEDYLSKDFDEWRPWVQDVRPDSAIGTDD